MLDDLKVIHERDAQDALGLVEKQWQQLSHRFDAEVHDERQVHNIVLAGMGGSALSAMIAKSWPSLLRPFEIIRDYHLPLYVDENTLFIASSYSGNTEETLAALQEAEKKGAYIVVIASGGALAERARKQGYPLYEIPSGMQPRMAVFYGLAALVQLFEVMNLTVTGATVELGHAAEWLSEQLTDWLPTVPTARNPAKQMALELMGKSAVIYSSAQLFPAAYKWKININENAKSVAWCNYYPEFNHNEMMGWVSHPIDKPYAVVDLRSHLDIPHIQKRFEVADKLLSGKRPAAHAVEIQGKNLPEQLLWAINFGDFVSVYLALLNGLNPTPVDLIEKFKAELKD